MMSVCQNKTEMSTPDSSKRRLGATAGHLRSNRSSPARLTGDASLCSCQDASVYADGGGWGNWEEMCGRRIDLHGMVSSTQPREQTLQHITPPVPAAHTQPSKPVPRACCVQGCTAWGLLRCYCTCDRPASELPPSPPAAAAISPELYTVTTIGLTCAHCASLPGYQQRLRGCTKRPDPRLVQFGWSATSTSFEPAAAGSSACTHPGLRPASRCAMCARRYHRRTSQGLLDWRCWAQ